jgi:hypothetical protein
LAESQGMLYRVVGMREVAQGDQARGKPSVEVRHEIPLFFEPIRGAVRSGGSRRARVRMAGRHSANQL